MTPIITLGGHTVNDRFAISDLKRPWPSARVVKSTVPGRHGDVYTTRTMGTRTVSFRLWSYSSSHAKLMEEAALLMGWLWGSDELIPLSLSDEGGRVRMVTPEGDFDFDEYVERGSVPVTLLQPDPLCDIGPRRSMPLTQTHKSFVLAYGNASIELAASSVSGSGGVWGVAFDTGEQLRVVLPNGTAESLSVRVTPNERVAVVDGATAMLTLDSDWPELGAGEHSAAMVAGSATATLSWQERCM